MAARLCKIYFSENQCIGSKMFHVYLLLSEKDKRTYCGFTNNLSSRLKRYNAGQVVATKHRRPLKFLFSEKFQTMQEAKSRELWWKSTSGRRKLKEILSLSTLMNSKDSSKKWINLGSNETYPDW
ncbi:MAG: hypothetical protein COV74_10290 [Candidatus Omnitrophica bacterium CG11_big_fil_rev_8_21_14_0_20_45_26]|uniref:GIY-YIG domain-containing protein n=1 Tax=Candidatus Abzuiibacterium crystallinum TaxID=1974748 RepID=A0A2H0LKP8_9BACT|nr:MAG: hypothetical protein COV74_10290 [Candidatus Omnitrophica bacterium CG11_big_fil_rev_8_21_14_0_20_45_26]PIW63941.1 MAG: hypothetical protein COW12_08530 [Candidatus Omnitrophica bacterium CG12_big_fil_rev_8_21_14_0_65_45_16]